jgi:endonuclease I
LTNGNFTTADFSGSTSLSIAAGSSSTSTILTLTDDVLDEGDEELILVISGLPTDIVPTTNSILRRVADNDYVVLNFGTPLNPTYNTVSSTAPTNYYASLEGLSGTALRQAIQDIIANPAVVHLHSYADIWEILKTADQNPANGSQVWCMYIEQPMSKIDQQQGNSIVGKWNREHIFCQSRGGFQTASNDTADGINVWTTTSASSTVDGVSDAHHIRAENGQENSSRNNKNYGLVNSSTVYAGPTNTQGSWKGDVARALFYMAVRFNALNVVNGDPSEYSGTNPSGNIGDLAALLTWHTQDPRDDYEMNRNNYVYTWQHNRNPFIDYPSLVSYVFGSNYGQPWSSALAVTAIEDEQLKVFPNPTTDYIQIEGITTATHVQITTLTGQFVYQTTIEQNQRLPLDLEAGIYFVKLSSQEKQTTKKIIVK